MTSSDLDLTLPAKTRIYQADLSLLDSLSPLKSSQGVLFVCRISFAARDNTQAYIDSFRSGTHILLDRVQDPGNVGTIIRSAHAFGINSILLTADCADIYNPKTIRATMGAIFKQKVYYTCLDDLKSIKEAGVKFIGTSSDIGAKHPDKDDLINSIIMFGNEGQGLQDHLLDLCDDMISIPLSENCESLNVAIAASIIMWETSKGSKKKNTRTL
jgi:TrmH family RNA methyltransferase